METFRADNLNNFSCNSPRVSFYPTEPGAQEMES